MIVLLYIAKSVWHFPVPWWMWIVAIFDGVSSAATEVRNIIKK